MSKAEWPQLLTDYFGKQWASDGKEPTRWLVELRRTFETLTDQDICGAIRARYKTDEKVFGAPTLSHLSRWLSAWMGGPKPKPVPSDIPYPQYHDEKMQLIYGLIDKATESHEVWAAIFDTSSLDPHYKGRELAQAYATKHKQELYNGYDGGSVSLRQTVGAVIDSWEPDEW